jgi:hypothetical protein
MKRRGATMKKLGLVAGVLIAATTAASAQGYVYYGNPYGYGLGVYDYSAGSYPGVYAYVRGPYTAPPGFYWDPTDSNWLYYRSSGPGRGNNEESTR